MGKRLIQTEPSDKEKVLESLGFRNRQVLIVQGTIPSVQEVLLTWTTDRSPMIVNVSQGKEWMKVLFATGTMLTFVVNKPGSTERYSLVIDKMS